LRATLPIAPEGFHVAGVSNGGLSAFRVALAQPAEFQSLTVLPGFPPNQAGMDNLASLDGIAINMFVGARDANWRRSMAQTVAELERLGQTPHFEILPGEGHVLRGIAGQGASRIFDLLQN
jgi:pimeloyl-ACP methyl ester carboxylesterase